MADTCWRMAETNTIVEQLPSIKKINSEKNVEWAMGEYSGRGLILDQGVSEGFQKEGMFKMHSEMSS